MDGTMIDERMQKCVDACSNCHDVCTETIIHCLQMGGEHAETSHIKRMLDCAEICQTSADFMLRMSDFHSQVCGVCAEVCERCGADCDRFTDDEMMKQCADACEECARMCHEMAIQI